VIEEIDKPIRSFSGVKVLIKRNIILLNENGYVNQREKRVGFEESIQV
jgi:hypothetical protein